MKNDYQAKYNQQRITDLESIIPRNYRELEQSQGIRRTVIQSKIEELELEYKERTGRSYSINERR